MRVLSNRDSGAVSYYQVMRLVLKMMRLKREDPSKEWKLWRQLVSAGLIEGLRSLLKELEIGVVVDEVPRAECPQLGLTVRPLYLTTAAASLTTAAAATLTGHSCCPST
jgi:hypothetical protein